MIVRLGWKDVKRASGIHLLVIMLMVAVFLTVISLVSAVQVKLKKYSALSPYLNKRGVYIESLLLAGENGTLLRDEKELKEYFPNMEDVLCMEQEWEVFVMERDLPVTLWSYSEAVTDALDPSMESGRWFQQSDMDSDRLKAVVTCNESGLKAGDIVTLGNNMTDSTEQVEIIGVLENNESLFYTNIVGDGYGDYRDCYYTYNDEAEEGNVLMLIADGQILNGESRGKFGAFNYRLDKRGFQKEMTGGTLVTYPDDVPQEVIDADMEKLKQYSMIDKIYDLSDMNRKSWDYILEEMYNYFPVFVCIFLFVVIAAVSANAITVKKQLKNYAVYYICGLPWDSCARISLSVACITSGTAFGMVILSLCFINLAGMMKDTALQLGLWQMVACAVIILCYVMLAWSIPLGIVRGTTAKEVMTNNRI